MLIPNVPDNPVADSWATPVFGLLYFVLVVALASLIASKWAPAQVKAAVAVAIFVVPFAGSIGWLIYSQARHRGLGRPSRRSQGNAST